MTPNREQRGATMTTVNRRRWLGGLVWGAGGALLGPIARRLTAEAAGAPGPRRLVMVVCGGGMLEKNYTCPARSETDFDLPSIFQPLEPYKRDLLILSKFANPFGKGLHGDEAATLTAQGRNEDKTQKGGSIDRFVAKRIGAGDPFSSINLGLWENEVVASLNKTDPVPNCSREETGLPYPAEAFPDQAFARIFADAATGGAPAPNAGLLRALDRSVLDFALDDVARLQGRLAAPERARLDQYLTSLRELETRLNAAPVAAPGNGCAGLAPPRKYTKRELNDVVLDENIDDHLGIIFNALACGRTKVATFMLHGQDSPHNLYKALGDPEGYHKHCHAGRGEWIVKTNAYWSQKVAKLWGMLRTVPEGSGTLADNTLLVYMNAGGGEHHNGSDRHAFVFLGNAGGHLRTGRCLTFPKGAHVTGDVFTSIAHAMGITVEKFGDQATVKGALPGLRA
jgi:hypothetical protein